MLSAAKALARRILPWRTRQALRTRTRRIWDWIAILAWGLRLTVTRAPLPRVLLFHGLSPGDDLLCTAVLRELRKRDQTGLLMISNHQQLFNGNRDVAYVRPAGQRHSGDGSVSIYQQFARIWGGEFKRLVYAPFDGHDNSEPPSRHIVADMCASAGIRGSVSIKPHLVLTQKEKAGASWARGRIAIQTSGMGARHPMRNKQWYEERFQGVVDELGGRFEFIQLGLTIDPPLRNVEDLRGATSIRASAAILHHARLYVGTVGFLMHLARAVECPSVVVYGGREAPWQTGYLCNINLYSAVPCAPCWRWNSCDFDRKCMRDITVDHVVSAIREMLQRRRDPLAVETAEIT